MQKRYRAASPLCNGKIRRKIQPVFPVQSKLQFAIMGLRSPFCDCQPKAASACFARARFIDTIEAIKHFVPVFLSDARAGIFDFD